MLDEGKVEKPKIDSRELKRWAYLRQRQKEMFCLRIKASLGMLNAEQLTRLADLARTYGQGTVHLTLRQGVEIPWIHQDNMNIIKEELEKVGLSISASGPRIRAVISCPGTRWCPWAWIDALNLAEQIDREFYGKEEFDASAASLDSVPFRGGFAPRDNPESLDFARDGARDGESIEPSIEGRSRTIDISPPLSLDNLSISPEQTKPAEELSINGERPSTPSPSGEASLLGTSPESLDLARDGSKDGEPVEPLIEGHSRTLHSLPHKFRISVSGCSNSCARAQENDVGFCGQVQPKWVKDKCSLCRTCEGACPTEAIKVHPRKKVVSLDESQCIYCGLCILNCPSGAWQAKLIGLAMYVGGKWGRFPQLGKRVANFLNEKQVLYAIRKTLEFYIKEAKKGERLANLLNRIGIDKLRQEIIS